MSASSHLLLPPRSLACCIAAAIVRDTRGSVLDDVQRMNFFPATPMIALTRVVHGQLHMARGLCDLDELKTTAVLPEISVALSSEIPTLSWSPGPVTAITFAIYPDAWAQLTDQPGSDKIPAPMRNALAEIDPNEEFERSVSRIFETLDPVWQGRREKRGFGTWIGSDKLADWTRHVIASNTLSSRGKSTRTAERAIRRWTGQSRKSLEFYAKLEELHRLRQEDPNDTLSAVAHAAQFADQSHMGRALKQATGFSPAVLNQKIATEEAFWCYRLLGQRF